MSDQPPTAAAYFHAALTDPQAAIDMLEHVDGAERDFLKIVACQQAIFSCFPSVPTTRQIREFTSLMRRLYSEEINTFAVATLITSCFNPQSHTVADRVRNVGYVEREHAMTLIPHAVYVHTRPAPDLVDLWVRRAVAQLANGRAKTLSDFGEDVGGLYRIILVDPEEVLLMLNSMNRDRWAAMVLNAATGALHYLFDGIINDDLTSDPDRQCLIDFLTAEHGFDDDAIATLDELIAYGLQQQSLDPQADLRRLCSIAVLLPRAMMKIVQPSPLTVIEFLKTCKEADDAMAAATPDHVLHSPSASPS